MDPEVLFCARLMPPDAVGGQERLSADVLAALRARFVVHDLANHGGKQRQWPYLLTLQRRLRDQRWAGRPMVVDGSDGSLARPLALGRKPAVLRLNGLDVAWRNPVYQAYIRRYLPRIPVIVANSEGTRQRALELGARPESLRIINPMASDPPPQVAARVPGRILWVGRLVPKKGAVEFVRDVWPALESEATLHIVGDGPQRPRLLEAIAAAPGRERIRWLGRLPQPDLEAEFAQASAFAMTSRPRPGDFEGFGIVAIEAAMRGVPVVAFPTDGVPDAVSPETGILLEGLEPVPAARAYDAVLSGARLADPAAIRRAARARWGAERFARQYAQAILDAHAAR